jgi:hypothetical protein
MAKLVTTAKGKKLNMTALREANKKAVPVGRKTIRKKVEEAVASIAPTPQKIRAVTPSNAPVSTPVAQTPEPIIPQKKGRR